MNFSKITSIVLFTASVSMLGLSACSSGPDVRQEDYARLKDSRTFEYEFPTVWHAIEDTFRSYVVTNRDPNKVGINEMKKIRGRSLDTDWVYSRSTEKYIEFKINDSPRKIYLQTRIRYHLIARTVLGGVDVTVDPQQEIERLKDDGSSNGFVPIDEPDRTLASAILDKIGQAILAAPNI
jgi:hypothetical protein